jgi:MFS family permease
VVSAADTPIRQAFVSELVGVKDVANAVSLNSATFNTARLIGPAIAGLLIEKMGTGPVFLANAGSYAAVLVGLLLMRDSELFQSTRQARSRGQLRAGVRYVLERPQLYLPLILVAVVCTLGLNFQITLALIAKKTFHRNAGTYGLLSSALAVGSLAGALLSARRGRPRGRLLVGAALTFGLLEIATGFMPTYWSFLALLIPTGVAALTFTTTANSTMQLNSAGNMRGRVMALYVLLFLGTAPFGAELVGWIAQTIGPRYSLIVGGVPSALTAVAVGLAMARASQVRIVPHLLRRRPHVHLRPIEVERVS